MASKLKFRRDACKGCNVCINFCPKALLAPDPDYLNRNGVHPITVTDETQCIGCKNCAIMCPDGVIDVIPG